MAALPDYVSLLLAGQGDDLNPAVVRTEVERGFAKHRVSNSRVVRKLNATLQFETNADANAFEAWYFDTIRRIGFFDVRHPRTGTLTPMRFEGGNIGELVPAVNGYHIASRAVVLEYLR